jgi:hypothetical protein
MRIALIKLGAFGISGTTFNSIKELDFTVCGNLMQNLCKTYTKNHKK